MGKDLGSAARALRGPRTGSAEGPPCGEAAVATSQKLEARPIQETGGVRERTAVAA